MPKANDWRLTNQEKYLQGATLRYQHFQKPFAEWNHEHCSFCWAKFMEEQDPAAPPDALHEGYATTDDCHWICATCFDDFRDQFNWQISDKQEESTEGIAGQRI